MHQSSLDKMLSFRERYLGHRKNDPLLILDLGSLDVNGSYRRYFEVFSWTYQGMDMTAGKNVDIVLQSPYNWRAIKSNSVDVLISGQAFEHIEFFWITMLEIARVLKPGGLCCIIAPAGGGEHKYPVDCWRFYPDGLSALGRFVRLKILEVFTQWEPDGRYTDESNQWQDTVLVCQEPIISWFSSWRQRLWRRLLHRLLSMGL